MTAPDTDTLVALAREGRIAVVPVESDGYAVKSYRYAWQVQLGEVDQYDQNFRPYEITEFPTKEGAQTYLDMVAETQPGSGRLVPKKPLHGYCSVMLVHREIGLDPSPTLTPALLALAEERDRLREALAEKQAVIDAAYPAMKRALRLGQIDVSDLMDESPERRNLRLDVFRALDMPTACLSGHVSDRARALTGDTP